VQELVEKEVTQTEVLHMECRETGEFAHRETTQYEQMESFNEEVVAEVRGAEEYVHLKSLDDEFHYMESTMPKKGSAADASQSHEGGSSESQTKKDEVADDEQEYGDRVFVEPDYDYTSQGHEYKDDACEVDYTGGTSQHPLRCEGVERCGDTHHGYHCTDDDILDASAVDQHIGLVDSCGSKLNSIDRDYLFEQVTSQVPFRQRSLKSPRLVRRVDDDDDNDVHRELPMQRSFNHESMHDID